MKARSLWSVSVTTSREAEEAIGALLETVFQGSPNAYTDAETGSVTVSVFLERPPARRESVRKDLLKGLARIKSCGLDVGPGRIEFRRVPREDWAESWKRHFHPMSFGRALLVKPTWSRRGPVKGQAVVLLDPGLSFGTGQHPTTQFCLQQLVRCRKPGLAQSFLDIGTGSGILAIAAVKLGYAPVEAFDSDSDSIRIARANSDLNGVKPKITRGDLRALPSRSARKFDVVAANLIANVLIEERSKIVARLGAGGSLILAGILAREFQAVQRNYEQAGLKLTSTSAGGEWRSGVMVKK